MKIGLDYIATIGGGGNSVYSKNLIDSITNIDRKNQYYLYVYIHDFLLRRFSSKRPGNVYLRPVYISSLGLPIPRKFVAWFNSRAVRFCVKLDHIDVFHFTNPLNFLKVSKKYVVTIHDLCSFHNDEWTKEETRQFFSERIEEIINESSGIIAVSNYTKQDIINFFGETDGDKIKVVYEAATSRIYYPDLDPAYLAATFNLTSYILYAGQLQPRKNILNILYAYANLKSELKEKYQLVLVGSARDQGYYETITETIARLELTPYVKILGRVDDNVLRKLYSGARVFVFSSLFEGFGLPVLESLQCGVPVITSNTTSLPEIAGDAGMLVNPENIEEISRAIGKMLTDEDFYTSIKSRSQAQAKNFSWEKAARETIAVYEKVFS